MGEAQKRVNLIYQDYFFEVVYLLLLYINIWITVTVLFGLIGKDDVGFLSIIMGDTEYRPKSGTYNLIFKKERKVTNWVALFSQSNYLFISLSII